jgi:hypothetical protein
MPNVRALPTNQLMPAVCSCSPPAATRCPGGRPGKNERPHPSPARTPGIPSIIMSPDPSSVDPDKAGRRHATLCFRPPHSTRRCHMMT